MRNLHTLDERTLRLGVFWITLGLLFWEGAVFWRETLFYLDGSKVLHELIRDQWFSFMHNRFWMALTQIGPLLAVKSGCSAHTVYLVQSFSFLIPPLLTLTLVVFGTRDLRAAVLVLFFCTFGNPEIHYIKEWGAYGAIFLLILTESYLRHLGGRYRWWSALITAVLIFLSINTHPTFLAFFVMLFFLRDEWMPGWKLKAAYIAIVAASFLFVVSVNIYVNEKIAGAMETPLVFYDVGTFMITQARQFTFIFLILVYIVYVLRFRHVGRRALLAGLVPLGFLVLVFHAMSGIPFYEHSDFYWQTQVFPVYISALFFPLMRLMQDRRVLVAVFLIAVFRFFYLNYSDVNLVARNMDIKESLITDLRARYPDDRVFLLPMENDRTLTGYPEIFVFYETYLMSRYLTDRPMVVYLVNDTTAREYEGRRVYYYTEPAGGDSVHRAGRIDPMNRFPELNLNERDFRYVPDP